MRGQGRQGGGGFGEHLALRTAQVCREGWGRGLCLTAEGQADGCTCQKAQQAGLGHLLEVIVQT